MEILWLGTWRFNGKAYRSHFSTSQEKKKPKWWSEMRCDTGSGRFVSRIWVRVYTSILYMYDSRHLFVKLWIRLFPHTEGWHWSIYWSILIREIPKTRVISSVTPEPTKIIVIGQPNSFLSQLCSAESAPNCCRTMTDEVDLIIVWKQQRNVVTFDKHERRWNIH